MHDPKLIFMWCLIAFVGFFFLCGLISLLIWQFSSVRARIVKRMFPDGRIMYVIQQRHYLFFWCWCDAWLNSMQGAACQDAWTTYDEAKRNLCRFDGTPVSEKVMSS